MDGLIWQDGEVGAARRNHPRHIIARAACASVEIRYMEMERLCVVWDLRIKKRKVIGMRGMR